MAAKDQSDTLTHINELVAEEKELRAKLQHHEIGETEEHQRLRALEDATRPVLGSAASAPRSSRDRRRSHVRPSVRPPDEVEGYLG